MRIGRILMGDNEMKQKLNKLEKVEFKDVWRNEREFDAWLVTEDGLKLLADELGVGELEKADMQVAVGSFYADVVLQEVGNEDEVIVVENQRKKTDHDHLGKMITYAAGLKAQQLVWIAEKFRKEHRAALEWLNNRVKNNEIGITGLEIELWKIGELVAPKFVVVSHINALSGEVKQSALSDEKESRHQFWLAFTAHLKKIDSPYKDIYYINTRWARQPIKNFCQYQVVFTLRDKTIRTEIYFKGRFINGHAVVDYIEKNYKDELTAELGNALRFDRAGRKHKAGLIRLVKENADVADTARWDEYHEWFAEMLAKFGVAFEGIIETIDPKDYPPPPPE